MMAFFEKHVNEMVKVNIIRPSTSPWASPVVIVPALGDHALNTGSIISIVSTQNSYPLPVAEHIFSMINGAKVFSCMDLKSGYCQIKMAEKSKLLFLMTLLFFQKNMLNIYYT